MEAHFIAGSAVPTRKFATKRAPFIVFLALLCIFAVMTGMDGTVQIALVGAGMFGGDVHARAYADLYAGGISGTSLE